MRMGAVLAVLLAAVACAPEPAKSADSQPAPHPAPPPAAKPQEPATVRGTVRWTGATVEPSRITMSGDAYAVGAWPDGGPLDPRFEVAADGALPHAFVWAEAGPFRGRKWDPPATAIELGAERAMYVPHVLGVQCGQALVLRTRDGHHYNFHAHPKVNEHGFNVCVEQGGVWAENHTKYFKEPDANVFRFDKQEKAIPVAGEVLSWMSAWVFVLDHPFFATTDAAGRFEIRGLPPGDYVFRVWHEAMTADSKGHEAETKVTLASGGSESLNLELR
jgi:hypothetical protein